MDQSIEGWRRFLSMEPLAFAMTFAFSISNNVMTDLIVYQTCKKITGLNESECDILHENSSSKEAMQLEKLVQPHTGPIIALQSCIEVIFPTMLALFVGPWSDKNGRKPLLLIPSTGYIIYYVGLAFMSSLDVNPYWLLLPSIPFALMGGFPALLLTFFCYVTDITDKDNRAWHLACLETSLFTGILVGVLVGPIIFKELGYASVFSLSALVCFFALLHAAIFVKETITNVNGRTYRSIFDTALVKELFSTVTKKREGYDRYLVWCCISVIAIHVVIMEGNSSIAFLFASSKLGWNINDYSIYSGVHMMISISGMLLLIKFGGSFLKIPDVIIIVISCLSNSAGCLTKAFVWQPWHMYLSSSIGVFSAASTPIMRCIISKSVSQNDLGKIFSVTTITEMIMPFATTPLYISIYTHTLNVYPCPVWFLSTVLPLIMIALIVIVERRWRRLQDTQYTPFPEQVIQ